MVSPDDTPRPSLKVYINAAPVAVFSVVADMENRASILSSVRRVIKVAPLPVEAGTWILEKPASKAVFRRSFRIDEFQPPQRIVFLRRWLGLPIRLQITFSEEGGGTRVTADMLPHPYPLIQFGMRLIARHWIRQWQRDLSDIKRHVEPRANPAWRDKLPERQSSGQAKGSHQPSK